MTASFLIRMDSNERTRYCGWDEAEQMVGKKELPMLLQSGKIEYKAPRTDCGKNAKWKIRRLHCFQNVKPVNNATELLANII